MLGPQEKRPVSDDEVPRFDAAEERDLAADRVAGEDFPLDEPAMLSLAATYTTD